MHEANFSITCGLNDCQRTFSKYESFRCHIYQKHKHTVLQRTMADDPQHLRWCNDDGAFEVCNPLGSKRNKQKLCAIYYTIGNMGTKYYSQLKHSFSFTSFCYHYYSYCVKCQDEWTVLSPGEEVDYQALDIYNVVDKLFISTRYYC